MIHHFGALPDGTAVSLYTISDGELTAKVTDLGATLVSLLVPDKHGNTDDVVLGFDDCTEYYKSFGFFGAVIGRNANRIRGGKFTLNGENVQLKPFAWGHNLHSGLDFFHRRMWQVSHHSENTITFLLDSPYGDQGFPGNARIGVTYSVSDHALSIQYRMVSDRDTVCNMTNHSYFNLAGHHRPELAMKQILQMDAQRYTPADRHMIPFGELVSVEGTALDFRKPKALDTNLSLFFKGYDHNYEVKGDPCAVLYDPYSGRRMEVSTDCPGLQLYTANGTKALGKGGIHYGNHCGVCLETQFYPDSVNHPEWKQPFIKAGTPYKSETVYQFSW